MDPNETLRRIRSIVLTIEKGTNTCQLGDELAELIRGLDHWVSSGGFLPVDWGTAQQRTAGFACSNNLQAINYPRQYRGHWIHANDDACQFEVHETKELPSEGCVEPLFVSTSPQLCEKAIDEVVEEMEGEAEFRREMNEG